MFSQEIADKICERLADGESLNAICKDAGYPAESTVRLWAINDVQGFAANYTRARELQAHKLFDEIIEIANTPVVGVVRTTKADGAVEEKAGDMLEHRRLQVDARKWYLSKVLPKVYGDKLDVKVDANVRGTVAYKANIPKR